MLHGTPSAPELVLDNQAAGVFAQAAETLAQLQRSRIDLDSAQTAAGGVVNVVNNNNVQNSQQPMILPPPAVRPESSNKLPI